MMPEHLKHIALRVFMVLLVFLFACSSALASTAAVVNTSALTVRAGASTSAKKLGSLPKGTKVKVVSTTGSWAKISYKGYTGYAASKYLTRATTTSSKSSSRVRAYTTKKVGVYKSASASSKRLGTVGKGTAVYVVGKSGSFFKVQNAAGTASGYIAKNALSRSRPSTSSSKPGSSSKASTVIAQAKKLSGKPYVHGCAGPYSFDCSGFTSYCYKQVGVSLSRSAQSQGYNNGRKLSKSELKPGDIVCFDTEENDSDLSDHVGIYLGGGRFIHASSAAGKVIISNLNSGYYAKVFSWGRRVL